MLWAYLDLSPTEPEARAELVWGCGAVHLACVPPLYSQRGC
jgi:hypothetical protein